MSKYKILIVDDDVDIIDTISFMLEKHGFDVITAFSGNDGLAKAKYETPDIIILDLMMPQMDGFEVGRELRGNEITKKIPLIILTARHDNEAHYKTYKFAADDFMVKPFKLPILLEKINKLIPSSNGNQVKKKGEVFDNWQG